MAWRSIASRQLVRRSCRRRRRPPRSAPGRRPASSTSIRVAPASSAFSTSSLTAAAGRSTTSPAAMRLTRFCGRRRIGAKTLKLRFADARAQPCAPPSSVAPWLKRSVAQSGAPPPGRARRRAGGRRRAEPSLRALPARRPPPPAAVRIVQPRRDPAHVLERHRLDVAVAPLEIVEAELVDLHGRPASRRSPSLLVRRSGNEPVR